MHWACSLQWQWEGEVWQLPQLGVLAAAAGWAVSYCA